MLTVILRPHPVAYPEGGDAFVFNCEDVPSDPSVWEQLRRLLETPPYLRDSRVENDELIVYYHNGMPEWPDGGFSELRDNIAGLLSAAPTSITPRTGMS
jgi:hypothetical protein